MKKTNSKSIINTKKHNWLLRHTLTVFSCVLIIALGITALTYADPVTTTIGENISTNDLSVAGNVTNGTWLGDPVTTQYGGTGQNWSATTQGNLPYFSGTGTLSNLAPGTTGQFLSQGSDGNPAWDNVARSATFVVATSVAVNGSSILSQQQADYVCDGVDDQEQIQAAIDALPDQGGKIILMEGIYNFASQSARGIDNITIKGMGASTKVNLDNSTAVFSAGSQAGWKFVNFATDAGWIDKSLASETVIIGCWNNGKITTEIPRIGLKRVASEFADSGTGTASDPWINGFTAAAADMGYLGTIYAPTGYYRITETQELSPTTNLIGDGFTATRIDAMDALNDTLFDFTSNSLPVDPWGEYKLGLLIAELKIGGNKPNQSSAHPAIILPKNDVTLFHIWVNSVYGDGTYTNYAHSHNYIACSIEAIYLGWGINVVNGCDRLIISDSYFAGSQKAVKISKGVGTTCNNILIHDSEFPITRNGILFESVEDSIIHNNVFIGQSGWWHMIELGGTSKYITVHNNIFDGDAYYQVELGAGVDYINILDNDFSKAVATVSDVLLHTPANTHGKISRNSGFVTENSGTDTLANGTTFKDVTHGLAVTPTAGDITVTPTSTLHAATEFWISGFTDTVFRINVDADPAHAEGILFAWKAIVL